MGIRGRKLTSQTATMLTIRCDNPEQYQKISNFARRKLGVSVNTFVLTTLISEINRLENDNSTHQGTFGKTDQTPFETQTLSRIT